MKVCVTSTGGTLDSQVDPRFGRCAYFIIVDTDTMEYEAVPNVAAQSMHGAGIQAAQIIANKGVQTVITGRVGPNAYQVLSASGIKIMETLGGTVREVINKYKSGQLLQGIGTPNVPAHFGMGAGIGMPGRGMRRFTGARYTANFYQPETQVEPPKYPAAMPHQNLNPQEELFYLENCRKKLVDELESIKSRIDELKKQTQKGMEKPV